MSYFISPKKINDGEKVELKEEEAAHMISARRLRAGEKIKIQDPDESRFEAQILNIGKKSAELKILRQIPTPPEPRVKIILFQAFVKDKALENIIQKGTELGVAEIIIFQSQNAPFNLSGEQKKINRFQKISQEAAKQCERARTPQIEFLPLDDVLKKSESLDKFFILDKSGRQTLPQAMENFQSAPKSVGVYVGPEGGLADGELLKLSQTKNAAVISFGPRILRADTAAISALAAAQILFGDMK